MRAQGLGATTSCIYHFRKEVLRVASWYLNEVGTRCAKTVTCKLEKKKYFRGVHTNIREKKNRKYREVSENVVARPSFLVFSAFRLKRAFSQSNKQWFLHDASANVFGACLLQMCTFITQRTFPALRLCVQCRNLVGFRSFWFVLYRFEVDLVVFQHNLPQKIQNLASFKTYNCAKNQSCLQKHAPASPKKSRTFHALRNWRRERHTSKSHACQSQHFDKLPV